uniref:dolichyl-phosphate-mannose--protein mannosyltransferase n=1 Tax=Parascaris univalens TaxID=6257 RepID=A0A914ZRK5_PARUN
VNVICHAITSALFIALTDRLTGIPQMLKLFCGLQFAVHAVHAEAVASIVGRADVLSTMCVLGAFYVHLHNEAIFMPILISAVGLLCKETAIVSLPILVLYCFIKDYRERRTHIVAFLSSTIFLCVLRMWIIGFSAPQFSAADNPIAHHPSALSRLLTFLYLPIFHLFLLIIPYNVAISEVDHRCESRSPSPKFDINANIIKHRKRVHFRDDRGQSSRRSTPTCSVTSNSTENMDENMQWLLSIALLVMPHVPASNLFLYVGFVVAERILYLPSTGFCILITLIIDRLYRSLPRSQRIMRKSVDVLCISLLLAHTIRLTNRNVEWGDEEALYRSAVLINPAKAYANLGNVLARRGLKEEAQRAYRRALDHRPNMADTHYNLGVLYQERGDYARALSSYHTAIMYRPTLASAHLNLGLCLWHQGKHDTAEQVFRRCLLLDSANLKIPRGHRTAQVACAYNLGVMLAKLHRHSDAIVAYTKAFELMDGDYEGLVSTLNMMGESLSQVGQLKEAEDYFRRALTVAPSHIPAYLTFSQLRLKQRLYSDALELLESAYRVDRENAVVHFHLGMYFSSMNDHRKALKHFKKALNLDPNNADTVAAIAHSHRQSGENIEAEKYYERLVGMSETAVALSNYAAILHLNGKYEQAEVMYKKAIRINPNDAICNDNLNKLHRLMSR